MFLNVAASVHERVLELSGLGFGSLFVSVLCCLDKSSEDVLDLKPVELNMVVKNFSQLTATDNIAKTTRGEGTMKLSPSPASLLTNYGILNWLLSIFASKHYQLEGNYNCFINVWQISIGGNNLWEAFLGNMK